MFDAYAPGIAALDDRSQFKPENFLFPILNPDLLDTVSILGPWDDKSKNECYWIYKVKHLFKDELSYLAQTFSSGRTIKYDFNYHTNDSFEQYAVVINFKTGERYVSNLIFRNDTVYLNDYKCYHILNRKFMDFINKIIKSRSVSTCNKTEIR